MNRGTIAFWAVLILGLGLRAYHYARGPAVWHDEAAMIANVLRLPIDQLLGPLLFDEASPPLFLLLEKATVVLLGDGIFSLRLPSFLASCVALFFVARSARQLLPIWYATLAVTQRLGSTLRVDLSRSYAFGWGGRYFSPQYGLSLSP